MLSSEDVDLLGMQAIVKKPSSAVSQVLRKISDDFKSEPVDWEVWNESEAHHYHIQVVDDRESRCRAYSLAHQVYHSCGFTSDQRALLATDFDADPETFTLLAQDEMGRDAGTITVNYDSQAGLPGDEVYKQELDVLRANGRKVAEVTRLAISEEHKSSKVLLMRLFNFICIYTKRVRGFDDFAIEVSPRHSAYYKRLLQFEQIGPERACPRVQNAMGVLLRLDISIFEQKIRSFRCERNRAGDRTLYRYFYSWLEEGAVAEFLAHNQSPMTSEDMLYFGVRPHPALEETAVSVAGQ